MKNRFSPYLLALAVVVSGCNKKPASPPATAQSTADQQPVVQAPAVQPPAPAPNTAATPQPKRSAEAVDIASLMNSIPTNEFTLSQEGGWDKFTMPKLQKWIRENLYGKRERINVCMLNCDVTQEDAAAKPDEWTISLDVTGIHANYAGMANRILPIDKEDSRVSYLDNGDLSAPPPTIGLRDKASFTFKCTEADARKWDALSKTQMPTVTIDGDIVGINFQPHLDASLGDFMGYDIFMRLEKVAVTPSKETEPGALYACEWMLPQGGMVVVPDEAITKIKRLDNSGDYQLIFLKYNEWSSGTRNMTKLISFSLAESLQDFNHTMTFTPCSNPPTESEIAAAKAAVSWPKK
jgi:hypothetical protein